MSSFQRFYCTLFHAKLRPGTSQQQVNQLIGCWFNIVLINETGWAYPECICNLSCPQATPTIKPRRQNGCIVRWICSKKNTKLFHWFLMKIDSNPIPLLTFISCLLFYAKQYRFHFVSVFTLKQCINIEIFLSHWNYIVTVFPVWKNNNSIIWGVRAKRL